MKKYVLPLLAVLTLVGAGEAAASGPSKKVIGPVESAENIYVPKAQDMTVIAKAPGLRGVVGVTGKVECYARDKRTSSYPFSARGKQVVVKLLPTFIGRADCIVTVRGTRNADVFLWKR